jgi:integrase
VSATTQNQALAALIFLYDDVLAVSLEKHVALTRARPPERIPVVLTAAEVTTLLSHLKGTTLLMASLLYGAGLRLIECARLRIKDLDLQRREIRVRNGKGRKDRLAPLPVSLIVPLQLPIEQIKLQHEADIREGAGYVELPNALGRKFPNAAREWPWQWLFPPRANTSIPQQANADATTYTKPSCSAQFAKQPPLPTSPNASAATPSATPSPPTFSNPATTSAPSKSSSAIATSPPP